jgi:hypothetical protein
MDFVDLLRSAWLVLVCGAAYAALFFRRVVLGRQHPLNWPMDIEVRSCQLFAQGMACWQVQEIVHSMLLSVKQALCVPLFIHA